MSKASREYKERYKSCNRKNSCVITLRKDLTLKAYRKWKRYCNIHGNGIKRHVACFKGRF